MDDERGAMAGGGEGEPPAPPPEQPASLPATDPWTVALLIFFVALIGVVAALTIVPGLGS